MAGIRRKWLLAIGGALALAAVAILAPATAPAEPAPGTDATFTPAKKPAQATVATTATAPVQAATSAAPAPAATAEPPPAQAQVEPNKVKAGMFITQLYDLDMAKRSFNVTFWGWYLTPDDKYKPLENVEVVNAKTFSTKFNSVATKDDVPWATEKAKISWTQSKYSATVSQDWDISKFPFDRQTLNIYLEDAINESTATVFIADADNSRIDDDVKLPGWTIESFKIKTEDSVYETTYGDPTLQGTSTYSRVVASIVVKRDGVRLLCSMFIGFFVAFILVLLTYCMDAGEMAGSRIGLSAGAIFAAIGNKYVVDNYLPPASVFTLADGIELATFLAIVFGILVTVAIQWFRTNHPVSVKKANLIAAVFSVIAYVGFIAVLITQARA